MRSKISTALILVLVVLAITPDFFSPCEIP